MSFGSPLLLLGLLLLVLVVAAYVYVGRRRNRYAVRFTNLEVLASVAESASSWSRHAPLALFLLALTALLVGVARPNMMRTVNQPVATVILVIDTSGSMFAEDVRPTRLEAAQKVVRDFVLDLPERYRVGVVAFSGQPELVAPVTDDHEIAIESLNYLFPQRGTAIGDAIARAVEVGRAATANAPPGERAITIVLLSDGTQTEGYLGPLQGAQRAKSFGIPVFTVALGTPEGVIERRRWGETRIIPVPPDRITLRQIAAATDGKYFVAASADQLRGSYERLGSLVSKVERRQEVTHFFIGAGAAFLLAAMVASALAFPRLP
ncbi:MAG: VWA domain-containing protein [Actinobacteria bacterium]|nr:VWA domain-containing protein [Actinomycetota bacterium]